MRRGSGKNMFGEGGGGAEGGGQRQHRNERRVGKESTFLQIKIKDTRMRRYRTTEALGKRDGLQKKIEPNGAVFQYCSLGLRGNDGQHQTNVPTTAAVHQRENRKKKMKAKPRFVSDT